MNRRLLVALITTLIIALSMPKSVSAADDNIFWGDTIPPGTIIDHDVVLFGKNVLIDGTVNGNVLVLGNQVIVNGVINGSLILIAQNAALRGDVTGTTYAVALTLDLPDLSLLERDLWVATVSLTSGPDSIINRHLYAVGLDAGLYGEIGGELHTNIGPIQLYNGLMRLLGFEELTLKLRFDDPGSTYVPQGLVPLRHMRLQLLEPLPVFDWGAWGLGILRQWAVLFIFGLLSIWLLPKLIENTSTSLENHPWHSLGIGLLVLVVSFNLFIVGLLLFILIFALGLGLNFLGLWQVTLAIWVVAFPILLIAMVGLGLFIAIGSKIIVLYSLSTILFSLFIHKKTFWLKVVSLLTGTIIYALLRSIPYAGWIIDLLFTSAGMGTTWLSLRHIKQTKHDTNGEKGANRPRKTT